MEDNGSNAPKQSADKESAFQQHYFFTEFTTRFMELIGDVKPELESKFPDLLNDCINNLHNLSRHAAEMISRQEVKFHELSATEQNVFMNQFMKPIDAFAMQVNESIKNITEEQESKLHEAYAQRPSTDN